MLASELESDEGRSKKPLGGDRRIGCAEAVRTIPLKKKWLLNAIEA